MWVLRAALSAVALAVILGVISQLPDIQRYLKIRNM
ncbi:MAG: DUF6893 family small protein [Chloroflexota bacterium]